MPFARKRIRSSALLAAIGALTALSVPTAADAATSCTFTAATGKVSVVMNANNDLASVGRNAAGAIVVNSVACSTATVSNTETISISNGGTNYTTAVIDLTNGPLGPGKTAEAAPSTSEIEIDVNLGASSDTLRILGGAGNENVTFGNTGGNLNGDNDLDVTYSGVDTFEFTGKAGNDTWSAAGDAITGGPINKPTYAFGGLGDDTLTGGSYGDRYYGDTDTESGGALAPAGNDTINGGDSGDHLHGNGGNDTLNGDRGSDTIWTDLGTDTYNGGEGGDYFRAESPTGPSADGADVFTGGAGEDTLDLSLRTGNLYIDLDNVADDGADTTAGAPAEEGDNVKSDVENIYAGKGNDTLRADTTAANDQERNNDFYGYEGNDVLYGGNGLDYLSADDGNDMLYGGNDNDTLYGEDGNDRVDGGSGDDGITGGIGDDSEWGFDGDDTFNEPSTADGKDYISAGAGTDSLYLGSRQGNQIVKVDNVANDGTDANQDGVAEELDDIRTGMEQITTGTGNDTITDTSKTDNEIYSGNGNDTINAGPGEDYVNAGYQDDSITGGSGEDELYGNNGIDTFIAADGYFDILDGGNGDGVNDVVTTADSFDQKQYLP